jgi:hypothetical protein
VTLPTSPGTTVEFSADAQIVVYAVNLKGVYLGDDYRVRLYQASDTAAVEYHTPFTIFWESQDTKFAFDSNGAVTKAVVSIGGIPGAALTRPNDTNYSVIAEFLHSRAVGGSRTFVSQGFTRFDFKGSQTDWIAGESTTYAHIEVNWANSPYSICPQ